MKAKLFLLVIAGMLTVSVAMAQGTDRAKLSFGVLGGINFQNLNGKDADGDKLENDLIIGFHVGVNIQVPIVPEFYFQPGLLFSTKGAKNTSGSLTGTTKISYIEMPMNLVYKAMLGNGYVMLGFGPYVAYGISGKEVVQGNSLSYERGVDYNAFDAGANIFFGYEMASGIFLQLDTQFGMLDIDPNENNTAKNTGFGLSLGYRF